MFISPQTGLYSIVQAVQLLHGFHHDTQEEESFELVHSITVQSDEVTELVEA